MKERPILFSGEMVKAILEGRKTQTRRVIKPQPDNPEKWPIIYKDGGAYNSNCGWSDNGLYPEPLSKCRYGKAGDGLWVRETWHWAEISACLHFHADDTWIDINEWYLQKGEEWRCKPYFQWRKKVNDLKSYKKRPSIFMPRWAFRILLEIKDIRVERIRDITAQDAVREGIKGFPESKVHPVDEFCRLWDEINAKRDYSWASSPWVWVIEFERIHNEQ